MKISKLFHWLYASLMLLPFASVVSTTLYYSFNKNAVIPQVDKEVSKEVDFNQQLKNNNFVNADNWEYSAFTSNVTFNNELIYINVNANSSYSTIEQVINIEPNCLYYLSIDLYEIQSGGIFYGLFYEGGFNANMLVNLTSAGKTSFITTYTTNETKFCLMPNTSIGTTCSIKYVNVINLTEMFGIGNEPSLQEFDNWFSNQYYEYTLSEHIIIPNYDTIQVADNSINHFWLPSFGAIGYNIQAYIGWLIGNVFGLNVVNGIGLVIVRLFTYWLIISICWLIFDLLMYVPNLVHKWLDKAAID